MYSTRYYNFDLDSSEYKSGANFLSHEIEQISSKIKNGADYYKIFSDLTEEKHIIPYIDIAEKIRNSFADLIIISMGGATLNPQTILSLSDKKSGPKIHFLHNTDPYFFAELMGKIDLKNCAIMVISNSGTTSEVLFLTHSVIAEFKKFGIDNLADRFFFITNSRSGKLKDIAAEIGGKLIEHENSISGRFAGLSNVSILPGLIAGINVADYLLGAKNVIKDFVENKETSEPAKAALACFAANKPIMVNLGYLQKFLPFLQWQAQIIAESLGKDGKGYSPIYGLGPNEQHTSLQLYLDGPQDKIFTIFYLKTLAKNSSEINTANFLATSGALTEKSWPVREFLLDDLSAKSVGALVCHFMLEIVLLASLMRVNPFDQPGVELIKRKASLLQK